MNRYLIPANSKKSRLILGIFTGADLTLFGIGVFITVVLLIIIRTDNIYAMAAMIMPALLTGLLVLPVPNYHNVLGFLGSFFTYLGSRKQYYWKGWCVKSVYGRDFEEK